MTALVAKLPNVPDLPVIGTDHATFSWLTLDELIDDATLRVPARSPLGSVQADAWPAVEPPLDGVVVVAPDVVDAAVVLALGDADLLPQPASTPTAAASTSNSARK